MSRVAGRCGALSGNYSSAIFPREQLFKKFAVKILLSTKYSNLEVPVLPPVCKYFEIRCYCSCKMIRLD